ncbi:MAG: 30S ribosomal protein S20, partial [Pirellulaceae bacterium]
MPNSKSAKKRLRQTEVRRDRNKAVKSALRSQLRKVREAVQAGDVG